MGTALVARQEHILQTTPPIPAASSSGHFRSPVPTSDSCAFNTRLPTFWSPSPPHLTSRFTTELASPLPLATSPFCFSFWSLFFLSHTLTASPSPSHANTSRGTTPNFPPNFLRFVFLRTFCALLPGKRRPLNAIFQCQIPRQIRRKIHKIYLERFREKAK